ncbi:helix-turn-helix transcriptional regulator [Streptomyces sp. E11-3]|uniref:helix-turn-helix transcriptional regulator n=1 Tax=Streptomyces sp. E11-3 TaxID=3110112 RepID=UPI003980EA0C
MGRFTRSEVAEELGVSDEQAHRAEQVLLQLHLLLPTPGDPDVLSPVSPDAAAAELVGGTENQIRDLQQAVTDIRSRLLSLMPAYFEGRRQRNRVEAFDVISDINMLRSMLRTQHTQCRSEILTAQPGGARPADILNAGRSRTLDTLGRGVRMRTLYQHTARHDLITSAYIREVSAEGAEFRTSDELIDRMIIYDREVVFVPEQFSKAALPGAVVIREPNLVQFICRVYEHLWSNATPFVPDTARPEPVADDVKQAILRLMARGYKDEMVARRLGMAVRTCRRHIAEITEELNATSRFQAGVNAAQAGLLEAENDAVDHGPGK